MKVLSCKDKSNQSVKDNPSQVNKIEILGSCGRGARLKITEL